MKFCPKHGSELPALEVPTLALTNFRLLKKTEQLRFVPLTNFALCGIQVERCFVHGAQIKNRSKTGNFVFKSLDDNKDLDGEYI